MAVKGDKAAVAHCGDLHGGRGLQCHSRPRASAAEPDHIRKSGCEFQRQTALQQRLMAEMDPEQVLKDCLLYTSDAADE